MTFFFQPVIRYFIFLIPLLWSTIAFSQTDTSRTLKEVIVNASRSEKFMPGTKSEKFDSATINRYSSRNLSDLLTIESQLFVKTYSVNGLATPSLRGTGASHTSILWNGFNLQSPMNGLLDLSLVPVDMMNSISVQLGGASALWGSGTIGGAIHLNNIPQFDKGLRVGISSALASFNDHREGVQVEFSKKNFVSTTKVFERKAQNNFPFYNIAQNGKPLQELDNAELKQYGLMHEDHFKIKENQLLSFRLWHQYNDRNLPADMTQGKSIASQQDVFYRTAVEWQMNTNMYSIHARTAFFDEQLFWTNGVESFNSHSHSGISITEFEADRKIFSNHKIHFGINNTYAKANTREYQLTHYQLHG